MHMLIIRYYLHVYCISCYPHIPFQAAIQEQMRNFCETKWHGFSEALRLGEGAAVNGKFVECH